MDNIFELILAAQQKQDINQLMEYNGKTEEYGLALTEEDAQLLINCRKSSLQTYKRVEFGEGILPKLIFAFCNSQYIDAEDYVDILASLQDLFYQFKNESQDNLTDDELISFMREQFEHVCFGSVDYLAGTCLERFAKAVRCGYLHQIINNKTADEYSMGKPDSEYGQLSEETRWERELYWKALDTLSD